MKTRVSREAAGLLCRLAIIAAMFVIAAYPLDSAAYPPLTFWDKVNSEESTYPSSDTDMLGAEAAYLEMEARLRFETENYKTLHPQYDEYFFIFDDIGHDPYVLISLLTAWHRGKWTLDEARETMTMLFDKQYHLSEYAIPNTKYRRERRVSDVDSTEHDVLVPYCHVTCYVKLTNVNLSHLPMFIMENDQVGMYAVYTSTFGSRPDLFGGVAPSYVDHDVSGKYLNDDVFAAMYSEAKKFVGFPYIWGGSNPTTSFDCSGFICWILMNTGLFNIGRVTAQDICDACERVPSDKIRPGDLAFFVGTYNTVRVSHVAMYVGDGWIIHAGNPIGYLDLENSKLKNNLLCYGRPPVWGTRP